MPNPLRSIEAKMTRARDCHRTVQSQIDGLMGSDPHVAGGWDIQYDLDAGWLKVFQVGTPEVPASCAALFGEFLYDLRSCLDHLAWQLVRATGNTPTTETQFPIFKNQAAFEKRAPIATYGMALPVRAHIENLQPFRQRPDYPASTTLWLIHDLCNIDKHRELHLTEVWCYTVDIEFRGVHAGLMKRVPIKLPKRLEDGAELAHYRWSSDLLDASGKSEVDMNFRATLDVGLGDPPVLRDWDKKTVRGVGLLDVMETMIEYMERRVLPTLVPFL